jgi:hypothetical protein
LAFEYRNNHAYGYSRLDNLRSNRHDAYEYGLYPRSASNDKRLKRYKLACSADKMRGKFDGDDLV